MSAIKEEVFVGILTDPSHAHHRQLKYEISYNTGITVPNAVDRDAAIQLLDTIKRYVSSTGWYRDKGLRPYMFDDFSYLDRSQAWWGWEFETGYMGWQERETALRAAYDMGVDGVTFDSEGEGMVASEVTFSPAEMSKFQDGTAPAYQFMQYLSDNPQLWLRGYLDEDGNAVRDEYEMVGTHLNLSHPAITVANIDGVAAVLNNSIHLLPQDDEGENVRKFWFGRRELYMGCHRISDYIEMKLFRTTYEMEEFKRYVNVAEVLTKIAVAAATREGLGWGGTTGVSNMLEMFKDSSVEPVFVEQAELTGNNQRQWLSGLPAPPIRTRNAFGDYVTLLSNEF